MKKIPSHLNHQLDIVFDAIEVGDLVNFDVIEGQAMCGKKARIASKAHSVVAGGTNAFDYIAFWIEKDNGQKAYIMAASTIAYDKAKRGVTFKGMLRDGSVVSGVISGFGV
jgi:hypothetical protein